MSFWANCQQNNVAPPVNTIPVNVSLPSISGATPVGSTLSCSPGEWSGTPTPSISYQWRRGTTNISGATQATYVTVPADGGLSITCRVTATNIMGSSNAVSSNAITPILVPSIVTAPVASGGLNVGEQLSVTTGTWNGTPPITYAYQWLRNGVAISGATAATYTTVDADGATALSCRVTATNSSGSSQSTSNALSIAAVPKVQITYGGANTSAANAASYTFTAQIGNDPGPDRYVVVCAGGRGVNQRAISGITIGGVAGVILATTGTCDNPQAIARSANPIATGTSITVTVSFTPGEMARYGAATYGVRAGGAPTLVDTIVVSAASADPTGTIDLTKNGGVIASAYGGNGNAITTSWTGVTENCDFATENNGNRFSAGNYMAANAETNRRITANFSGNNSDSLLAVSFAAG